MDRSNTCAWPEVENEVGLPSCWEGIGKQRPGGGCRESCQGASQAGLAGFQRPAPGGGSDKYIQGPLQNTGVWTSVIRKHPFSPLRGISYLPGPDISKAVSLQGIIRIKMSSDGKCATLLLSG